MLLFVFLATASSRAAPSASDAVSVPIQADPPGLECTLDGKTPVPLSEGALSLHFSDLGSEIRIGDKPPDDRPHNFRFDCSGFGSLEKTWSWNQLLALEKNHTVTKIELPLSFNPVGWFRRHPLGCLVGLSALLVAAAALNNRLQSARHLAKKDELLQALTADADVRDHFIMQSLGGYRLVQRLGAGGMALVYKGVPVDTLDENAAVAIKVIKPEEMNKEFEKRFEREIKVSMKLNHPNVVRVVTWGSQEGLHYLVMELVNGKPLSHYLPENGMSLEEVRRYAPPIFEALAYAHKLGIVHRDLKPDNVMVTNRGLVKLMDFGLARNREVKTVTVTGSVMGTPQYMAPEQIMSGPRTEGLDDRSDQYALGCMLFEMLCGHRPFEHEEPMKVIMMHLTADPPLLSTRRAGLPPALEKFISRMLLKDPNARYPSMQEASLAFMQALDGKASHPASSSAAPAYVPPPPGDTVGLSTPTMPPETVGIARPLASQAPETVPLTPPLAPGGTVAVNSAGLGQSTKKFDLSELEREQE